MNFDQVTEGRFGVNRVVSNVRGGLPVYTQHRTYRCVAPRLATNYLRPVANFAKLPVLLGGRAKAQPMRRTTPTSSSATAPDKRSRIFISRTSPADDQRPSCRSCCAIDMIRAWGGGGQGSFPQSIAARPNRDRMLPIRRHYHGEHCQRGGEFSANKYRQPRWIFPRMGLTTCQKCGTKYISVAKKRPPVVDPCCEVCNQPFPRMESGRWLHYQRADDPLGPETALRGN